MTLRVDEMHELLFERRGSLPLPCYFCGKLVTEMGMGKTKGHLHHINHDNTDQRDKNWAICHHQCHNSYHGAMLRKHPETLSEQHKKAIGDGVRGTKHTDETRANMAESARKKYADRPDLRAEIGKRFSKPKSEEHRKKLSDAQKIKTECPNCGVWYNKSNMTKHSRKCSL